MAATNGNILRIGLPKGRMQDSVVSLLSEADIRLSRTARSYRPETNLPDCEIKLLKPQNIVEMLHVGSRDVAFAGADWVAELKADLVELVDTKLDPVSIVAAAPEELLEGGRLPARHLVVASEYEVLAARWMAERQLNATFLRSYGATEVFPPEDADVIVDNSATGSTLHANGLHVVDELMRSSTRLYASPRALRDDNKKQRVLDLAMLVSAVLEARRRVMVEFNVSNDKMDAVLAIVPCMRQPTIATLAGGGGVAVKAAVPRAQLPQVIPQIKGAGGTDIVVINPSQIVP